jgi:hypothetical protein
MAMSLVKTSVLMLVPFLPGCVAIGFYGTHAVETTHVEELLPKRTLPAGGITTFFIMDTFGDPNSKTILGPNSEEWIYTYDLRLNGVVLVLLLPIPLAIPVGHEYLSLTIENGIAVSAKSVKQSGVEYIYGCIPGACFDFGARVHRF